MITIKDHPHLPEKLCDFILGLIGKIALYTLLSCLWVIGMVLSVLPTILLIAFTIWLLHRFGIFIQ